VKVNDYERAALEHERSLNALLEQLGDPALPPKALEAAARACEEAFERMRAFAAGETALERARTQTALVIEQARRELEQVQLRLQRVREARRAWSAQSAPDPRRACDVEG
jgi:hypothetical protein